MSERQILLLIASLLGGLAVLLGAFGAHALQLTTPHSGWFETASQYHFYHSLALLILAVLPLPGRWRRAVAIAWVAGLLMFSGSLYLAAVEWVRWFWLTPVGGVALLLGWLLLALAVTRPAQR